MINRYFEFNGRKFQFQNDLGLSADFLDLVLMHGDEALRAVRELEHNPEYSELLKELLESGLLERFRGRFRLTPKAVNAMQRKALMEIFRDLRRGTREGHASAEAGVGGERIEGTRPYHFGDSASEIDVSTSLRNAIRRRAEEAARARSPNDASPRAERAIGETGALLPLRLRDSDLERFESESRATCSTVVLLDQSGSMARSQRFLHAKRTALGLIALIRQRFSSDTIDLIGFATGAEVIPEDKLPLLMPKPVTLYDPVIRLKVPIHKLDQAPPHFTNLHLGLLKARQLLRRRGGENKMIFIITDGQPTAHMQGDYVYLIYPPGELSHVTTLKEAYLIARQDVRICTFALTDDYWDMDWLGFVNDLGRLTRGVTFHCVSSDLSACVMESYLSGRRKKAHLA